MPPIVHTFSDEINYLIWRYLREANLSQTAWTLEAEIRGKSGKDILSTHEHVGKHVTYNLPQRLRMSMQYQEVLQHMSEDGDLPCTAPFTLLSEHTCNKGEETRIPIQDVTERPWQLDPSNFPHGEQVPLSNATQQPRQSRRLNRDENNVTSNTSAATSTTTSSTTQPLPKGRAAQHAKRRKPNNLPITTLATGIVEEEESNLDDEMEEDTVIMNGEDVVMKEPAVSKPSPGTIHVIPGDRPLQFGDDNTFIAAWNQASLLATGYVVREILGENRLEDQVLNLPINAQGTFNGATVVWNIDGSMSHSFASTYGPIFTVRFNPSGTYLVACSATGMFEVFETKGWSSFFTFKQSSLPIWEIQPIPPCVTWIDDTQLIILSSELPGSTVNCWQLGEFAPKAPFIQLSGHEKLINDIQYDKPSGYIATASDDHTVRLWKLDKSSSHHEFKTHTGSVRALSFQPSDSATARILASGSYDGTVSIYNISTLTHLYHIGPTIHSFPGDRISCLSWSPDGKYLCTGDLEGVLGVWEWRESSLPSAFAIWAPDRIQEDQSQEVIMNGMNGHDHDADRPVHEIHWQKNGQSIVVCRENRKVALINWPLGL